MTYWVIRHDVIDAYLSHAWAGPRRRWRPFDENHIRKFSSKAAAELVVDTLYPGALVFQVSENPPESLGEHLPEWYRERIRRHIENKHQQQHRQGFDVA